jgi:hypothetical protein
MKATSNAGELVAEIYRTLWEYNPRIQSALERSLLDSAGLIAA